MNVDRTLESGGNRAYINCFSLSNQPIHTGVQLFPQMSGFSLVIHDTGESRHVITKSHMINKKFRYDLYFKQFSTSAQYRTNNLRGFIKFLCRRSVEFYSRVFLVFLMKESKKRR